MKKGYFHKLFAVLAVVSILASSGSIAAKVFADDREPAAVSGAENTETGAAGTDAADPDRVESDNAKTDLKEADSTEADGTDAGSIKTDKTEADSTKSDRAKAVKADKTETGRAKAEPSGEYKLTAEGDGYTASVTFAAEDFPKSVNPEELVLSVGKLSDYSRVDAGIEPVRETTVTLPTFTISLRDADGKDVSLKNGKTFQVAVDAPADIFPEMADASTLKLVAADASDGREPAVIAAADGSDGKASLTVKKKAITVSFRTAALAACYGFDFRFLDPVPIRSSAASAVRASARKAAARKSGETDELQPEVHKTVTPNGDGTYQITLSVTGKAQNSTDSTKADVIVVYDKSSSMSYSTNYYYQDANGPYGLVYGQYLTLYTREWVSGGRRGGHYEYTEVGTDATSETLYYRYGRNYYAYSGSRYAGGSTTRASAAKKAVDTLAQSLLTDNNNGDVQLSIITFGTRSGGVLLNGATAYDGNTKDKIETLDDIGDNEGTNWEAALNDALTQVNSGREGASKYVIFVSDGDPTIRTSSLPYQYEDWYWDNGWKWGTITTDDPDDGRNTPSGLHGAGDSDDYGLNYQAALRKAEQIVTAVGADNFFAIGAFGNVSNMRNLVTDSKAASGNYYDAADGAALAAAFESITKTITHALEIRNAELTDNVTSLTSVGMDVDENNTAGSFTYSKSNDPDWQPGTGNQAVLEGEKVKWSPVPEGQSLEAGVTYSVSFDVWPSQKAYDLVTDLMNETRKYDELTQDQKDQIVKKGDGTYALKTNSTAKDADGNSVNQVTYTKVELDSDTEAARALTDEQKEQIKAGNGGDVKIGDNTFRYNGKEGTYEQVIETTTTIDYPDPNNGEMSLSVSQVNATKKWVDSNGDPVSSDDSRLANMPEATLKIYQDGGTEAVKTITLNSGNRWEASYYISSGLMKDDGTVLEKGHDYFLKEENGSGEETAAASGLTYEFSSETIRPMVIGSADSPTIYKKDDKGSVTIDDKNYTAADAADARLIGTNTIKAADLKIEKILTGTNLSFDNDFTITLKLDDTWKGLIGNQTFKYRISKDTGVDNAQEVPEDKAGGSITFKDGSAQLTIKNGWIIDIKKLPKGVKLTVAETTPQNYRVYWQADHGDQTGKLQEGTSADGIVLSSAENKVTFTNESKVVITGLSASAGADAALISAMLVLLAAGAAMLKWKRGHSA